MQETVSYILNLCLYILPIVGLAWLGAWVLKVVFFHQTLLITSPLG